MIKLIKKYQILFFYLLGIIFFVFLVSLFLSWMIKQGVGVVSVSSDGRYAITTDENKRAILWDLQKHSSKVLDKKAHVFSAYFIPQTQDYFWQDQNKIIHIRNIENKNPEDFKIPYFSFGQAMTADRKYFMIGDIAGGLHLSKDKQWVTFFSAGKGRDGQDLNESNKLIADKPYNLSISLDQNYFLGVHFLAELLLWDIRSNKKFPDNIVREYDRHNPQGKAFATLSPNGAYVVGGDESAQGYVWETATGRKLFDLVDLNSGVCIQIGKTGKFKCDKRGLIPKPKEFVPSNGYNNLDAVLAFKFIDKTHYLRFTTYIPYAILYDINSPLPIKYFPLGRSPWPAVNYYARNQAIDTSWQSHTLVMGKETGEGILVYQYDPEKQTLTKVWDGHSCVLPSLGCVI